MTGTGSCQSTGSLDHLYYARLSTVYIYLTMLCLLSLEMLSPFKSYVCVSTVSFRFDLIRTRSSHRRPFLRIYFSPHYFSYKVRVVYCSCFCSLSNDTKRYPCFHQVILISYVMPLVVVCCDLSLRPPPTGIFHPVRYEP